RHPGGDAQRAQYRAAGEHRHSGRRRAPDEVPLADQCAEQLRRLPGHRPLAWQAGSPATAAGAWLGARRAQRSAPGELLAQVANAKRGGYLWAHAMAFDQLGRRAATDEHHFLQLREVAAALEV